MKDLESICSGSGWWSVEYFHSEYHFDRVVAFSSRNDPLDDERMEIVAITQNKYNQRSNGYAQDNKYFVGIVHDDQFLDVGSRQLTDHGLAILEKIREERGL